MIRPKNGVSKVVKLTERLDTLAAERKRIDAELRELRAKAAAYSKSSFSDPSKALRTVDVMAKFGVTRATVMKWVHNGYLSAVVGPQNVGHLFDSKEVDAFVPPPKGNPRHRELREQRGNN